MKACKEVELYLHLFLTSEIYVFGRASYFWGKYGVEREREREREEA